MIASIRSSTTISSHEATPARAAKIAELNKRVGSLQQELKNAQDMKPAELAGLRRNSISQDIVAATSQIEKIVLASQLARLALQSERPPTKANPVSDAEPADERANPSADKAANGSPDAKEAGAPGKNRQSDPADPPTGVPSQEDALKAARERLAPEQRAVAQIALHAAQRQSGAAAADMISSTYHADGEKVQQINLKA